jgi:hypothetical protein
MMAKGGEQVSQPHIRSLTAKVENHCLNKCELERQYSKADSNRNSVCQRDTKAIKMASFRSITPFQKSFLENIKKE